MNNYFAICKSDENYIFRDKELLGKMPHEIILSRLNDLNISESYATSDSSSFSGSILDILDWAVTKNGSLVFADERAVLLSGKDYKAMLNACTEQSPFIAALDDTHNEVCAFACNIDDLVLCMSRYNIGASTLSELYHQLLAHKIYISQYDIGYERSILLSTGLDYPNILKVLASEKNNELMQDGVLFFNPETCFIDLSVSIGNGTIVYPGNIIKGDSTIGSNCTLFANSRITNAKIGNSTTIESSVLIDCSIGSNTTVGPFAYIRPGSKINDNCRIGDFVEVKNSNIDDGTKVSHLTYVGDSDLGKNINIGCGVVFVNYDGKIKQRSTIEDNAFIGCNTNIVAPVTVETNAYVAAGSTITENVPKDSLHISRSRAVIKENWAKKRREDGRLK